LERVPHAVEYLVSGFKSPRRGRHLRRSPHTREALGTRRLDRRPRGLAYGKQPKGETGSVESSTIRTLRP
jgi:hypothetical protein